jgi:hypothetical protein
MTMETALPALGLFLIVLVRLYILALRQPAQSDGPQAHCRLHRWERTDSGLVCKECGMRPTED